VIRDTGIGIPKEKLDNIFAPFQQADGSTTRRFGGTGLGLSICKQISNLMDGDVWAESEVGDGSTFHFTAWLGKAEDKETKKFIPVSLSGKKALIVGHNQINQNILTHLLESVGMGAVAIRDSDEVISTLKEALETKVSFDLCIIDFQTYGADGHGLAKQIRQSKYQFSNIPLIALSSSIERDAKKCEEVGFDCFLSKPVRRGRLYQMLERIIGERQHKDKDNGIRREKIMTQYSIRENMKHSVRILLVEDNLLNQRLTKMMLAKSGYRVEVASNGKEAVKKYATSPQDFDLIFMDIQMPEMDGIDATKEIRRYEEQSRVMSQESRDGDGFMVYVERKGRDPEPAVHHIPIVAMTAHAMKGDKEKFLKAGMDDYIAKPIKREIVFEILEKFIFNNKVS
jgi:CheY-like chemotaxis protein